MGKAESISKIDLVVYALAVLGGAHSTVHSEDIAAKCYELAPSRFSWGLEKYKRLGWPDKYIVKTALEDAKKDKYSSLVEGAYALEISKDGWRLAPNGAAWLKRNQKRIEHSLDDLSSPMKLDQKVKQRFLKNIRSQPLFRQFSKSGKISGSTQYEFRDMLSCSPDAIKEVVALKFGRLLSTAQLTEEEDVIRFLETCKHEFRYLLQDSKEEPTNEKGG